MSHAAGRLLSSSYLQAISSASRHQLRARRLRIVSSSNPSRTWSSHRAFTTSRRLRQDQDEKSNPKSKLTHTPEEAEVKPKSGEKLAQTPGAIDSAKSVGEDSKPELSTRESSQADSRQANVAAADALSGEGIDTSLQAAGLSDHAEITQAADEISPVDARSEEEIATILAHGESEAHRDLREYARLAAWELPLLHKLKQPFEPPTSATPLRFRYTSYMGEDHPASKKVVVEFKPSELPGLDQQQQIKLIKLAGPRYNPEKQSIKMSCESFATPAENKRYLGDLLQKLMREAKNSKDMFADVPIDLRHYKQKPIYKFPEEWKITRPARIESGKGMRGKSSEKRRKLRELQQSGNIVDGVKIIEEAMAAMPVQRIAPKAGGKTILGSGTRKASAKGRLQPGSGTKAW